MTDAQIMAECAALDAAYAAADDEAARNASVGELRKMSGKPGTDRSLLWNLDVAMEMAEAFLSESLFRTLPEEVRAASSRILDMIAVEDMLWETGLSGEVEIEA